MIINPVLGYFFFNGVFLVIQSKMMILTQDSECTFQESYHK